MVEFCIHPLAVLLVLGRAELLCSKDTCTMYNVHRCSSVEVSIHNVVMCRIGTPTPTLSIIIVVIHS